MHFKSPKLKAKEQMASIRRVTGGAGDDDGDGSRSTKSTSIGHSPRSCASNNNNRNTNNNNNNNTNNDSISNSNSNDSEVHLKKQALEQRKEELERLLSQKTWLLQQLQKQETQILNGNYNYLNLNEIFTTLQQCKQSSGNTLLRRKSTSAATKANHSHQQQHNNNNNASNNNNNISDNNNRNSDVSSRSSEYDNYPNDRATIAQQTPLTSSLLKVAPKQRQVVPITNWNAPNALCQQHHQQQHHQQQQPNQQQQQQQQQQFRQQYIAQMTEQQHFQYTQQQILQKQHQQQQQQRQLLQHQHYHPRQQLITAYHSPVLQSLVHSSDGISLYSSNSANISTTIHQQPSQPTASALHAPIVVNCDKYYLSPTHHSYSDGGFIKSSQNIKQYVSPLSSPNAAAVAYALGYEPPPPEPLPLPLHHQPLYIVSSRSFDAISLSPSLAATIDTAATNREGLHTNNHNNLRWRSQSNIQYNAASLLGVGGTELKTHSSDMLRNPHSPSYAGGYFCGAVSELKPKPLDDISVASFSSETQRKSKPKQWLESSLDGPPIRSSVSNSPNNQQQSSRSNQSKPQTHMQRDRPRLSSQSMTAGSQRYTSVIQRGKSTHPFQDDENKFAKFSQSTSYLNSIDALTINTYLSDAAGSPIQATDSPPPPTETNFHYNPPKIVTRPLPSQASKDKLTASPEIRIESPKNVRIVQQATFQPYKEVTKPFEMSDFYKYSTKFKQKEATGVDPAKLEMEETGCGFSTS